MTGDVMAEDPLCSYTPGRHREAVAAWRPAVVYGEQEPAAQRPAAGAAKAALREVEWEPEARQRMKRVPAFVRGLVVRRVESWCRENGVRRVTLEQLEQIRAKMPTPKVFGR